MSNHSDKSQRKKPGPLLMRAYEATEVMIKCARVVLLLCVLAILYFSLTSTAPGVACSFCTFFISLMMLGGGKGNEPLTINDGGRPYRAFLEGKVKENSYCLIMHFSNQEYKAI